MSVEGLILYHSSPVKNINATISSPNVLMNYKMSAIAKKNSIICFLILLICVQSTISSEVMHLKKELKNETREAC